MSVWIRNWILSGCMAHRRACRGAVNRWLNRRVQCFDMRDDTFLIHVNCVNLAGMWNGHILAPRHYKSGSWCQPVNTAHWAKVVFTGLLAQRWSLTLSKVLNTGVSKVMVISLLRKEVLRWALSCTHVLLESSILLYMLCMDVSALNMTALIKQASVFSLSHPLNSRNGYECGYGST